MRGNKRVIIGLAIGVAVFAATFGMAASLGLSTEALGADDKVVAACETDETAPVVSYTTVYNTTGTLGYKVDDVVIENLDNACDGDRLKVTLSGATASETIVNAIPADASTTVTVSTDETKLASEVTGVHVVISDS